MEIYRNTFEIFRINFLKMLLINIILTSVLIFLCIRIYLIIYSFYLRNQTILVNDRLIYLCKNMGIDSKRIIFIKSENPGYLLDLTFFFKSIVLVSSDFTPGIAKELSHIKYCHSTKHHFLFPIWCSIILNISFYYNFPILILYLLTIVPLNNFREFLSDKFKKEANLNANKYFTKDEYKIWIETISDIKNLIFVMHSLEHTPKKKT